MAATGSLHFKMAETVEPSASVMEKNSKILVNVDETLPDILVVSYRHGTSVFQGVLLDSTKRSLPFGVPNLHPAFTKPDENRLYSVSQRFSYLDPSTSDSAKKKPVRPVARYKNSKMTVRLRPRQVLCSKCREICNENSENVDNSRKRKSTDPPPPNTRQQAREKRAAAAASTAVSSTCVDSQPVHDDKNPEQMYPTLIPRLSRLDPSEISSALSGNSKKLALDDFFDRQEVKHEPPDSSSGTTCIAKYVESECSESDHSKQHSDCSSNVAQAEGEPGEPLGGTTEEVTTTKAGGKRNMVLRKKKSVGSMEDLWDESVFEEAAAAAAAAAGGQDITHNTRTIKISFGTEGEGTVLKIPAKIDDLFLTPSDMEENAVHKLKTKDASAKAARRALKKAKKEARRKFMLTTGGSPCYIGNGSPRYTFANGSPRYTITASPRPGNNSPRYTLTTSTFDGLIPRRHKHKVKHKKRHREERKHREVNENGICSGGGVKNYVTMKQQCLTQKLSINLKRITANAYTRCDDFPPNKSPDGSEEGCDEHCEAVPNFPPTSQAVMMQLTQSVTSGLMADGRRLSVGDVVWGKIHGFPWWPGKVLSITATESRGSQAHVAWYGSSTSSLMPCDQLSPFLENFKIRYNKKKRGPYKEAIKQATYEARTGVLTAARPVVPIVSPALASPREIDVMS